MKSLFHKQTNRRVGRDDTLHPVSSYSLDVDGLLLCASSDSGQAHLACQVAPLACTSWTHLSWGRCPRISDNLPEQQTPMTPSKCSDDLKPSYPKTMIRGTRNMCHSCQPPGITGMQDLPAIPSAPPMLHFQPAWYRPTSRQNRDNFLSYLLGSV